MKIRTKAMCFLTLLLPSLAMAQEEPSQNGLDESIVMSFTRLTEQDGCATFRFDSGNTANNNGVEITITEDLDVCADKDGNIYSFALPRLKVSSTDRANVTLMFAAAPHGPACEYAAAEKKYVQKFEMKENRVEFMNAAGRGTGIDLSDETSVACVAVEATKIENQN